MGDAEIDEFDRPTLSGAAGCAGLGVGVVAQHVGRLDVAVDDVVGVGVGERVEQAEQHITHADPRQPTGQLPQ